MDTDELTYGSYLRVPELLALQQPRSEPPHPEELHFIVVHQALELWMKLLQHDLGRIVGLLDGDGFGRALALLGRVNHTLDHALDQMRSLHSLPPWDLQQFRSYLGRASGSQSVQFRELELRSGLREPGYLKALEIEYGGRLPEPLATRLAQRSLAEAHAGAAARLARRGRRPLRWAACFSRRLDACVPPPRPPPSAVGRCPVPAQPTWSGGCCAQSRRHSSPPPRC